jgi:hypothetical protein
MQIELQCWIRIDNPGIDYIGNYRYIKFFLYQLMANTSPFKDEIVNSSLEELMKTVSESPYTMQKVPPR